MGGTQATRRGKCPTHSWYSTFRLSQQVVHKATLQLDEKGMQAAAPTGVTRKVGSEPLTIHFNRPFIIMIFDEFTWSSLFLVKVVNPT